MQPKALALTTMWMLGACVPEGPSTAEREGQREAPVGTASGTAPLQLNADPALQLPFEDKFERSLLGADYRALSPQWHLQGGRLCARGARNRGVWLTRRLPTNARIEFDAVAESSEGDLKVEAWGDGLTGATGAVYNQASSYVIILGGWNNRRHVIARLDEHGRDRREIEIAPTSEDEREHPIAQGQVIRVSIERRDGRTLDVKVDGSERLEFDDEHPLHGKGHEFFGFNDWEAPVCFDNLRVTPL